jgi:hypothetical protein
MKKFVLIKSTLNENIVNFGDNGIIFWGPNASSEYVAMYNGSGRQGFAAYESSGTLANLQAAADALADACDANPGGPVVSTSVDIANGGFEMTDLPIS